MWSRESGKEVVMTAGFVACPTNEYILCNFCCELVQTVSLAATISHAVINWLMATMLMNVYEWVAVVHETQYNTAIYYHR